MRIFFLLSCLAILITANINAQAPANLFGNITIASPNAAALGKYGDYPVGYHTGVPSIGIPIYTVKEGELSLPISLSYHASGLKVMETASWVGASWSLNAGGAITRSVMGQPDDKGYLSNVLKGHFSDYGYNSYLTEPSGGGASPSCYSYPEDNIATIKDADFLNGKRDGEPDLFFFNFGSYSGKFYFRDDRTPVLVPEADFKIVPVTNTILNIVGFVITTPDGVKYTFGKNSVADGNIDATESTSPYTADAGLTWGTAISSWYLNKITSADNANTISLFYQAEQYSYYTISMFPVAQDDLNRKHTTLVKNFVTGVRLSSIKSSTATVTLVPGAARTDLGEFNPQNISDVVNTNAKILSTINIADSLNSCRKYIFSYDYFVDNTSALPNELTGGLSITTDNKRLKLLSLQEQTCDNSKTVPPYTFSYTTGVNGFVPRRLNFAQDHWGFYNGKTSNNILIPTLNINDYTLIPGADRESSWPELSYGSLNKIIYPTGGNTQFNFEANDTWANYNYFNDTYTTSYNTGPYIGVTQPQPFTVPVTGNKYRFIIDYKTNQYGNSVGTASVAGITVSKLSSHGEIVVTPQSGANTYTLSELDMTSANQDWATLKIYEIVPSHFQNNKVIGGLRIQSINNYDNVNAIPVTTSYNYKSGTQSSGILYSRPVYVQVLRNDIIKTVGYALADPTIINGCLGAEQGPGWQVSPASIRPMATTQGNHIGYNNVEVSQVGNGKTVYYYYGSNIWDQNLNDVSTRTVQGICDPSLPNYPPAPLPTEFMTGELKFETTFDQSSKLLRSVYYYPVYIQNPITTPGYIGIKAITLYNQSTSKKTQLTTITNNFGYAVNDVLTTIDSVFYSSQYHNQVTRAVDINSKGEISETRYKYAFDFRIPSCDAISDCYQTYLTSYNNALSTYNYKLATCVNSGSCNCRYPAFQTYRYQWSQARKAYVSCRRSNFMDTTNNFKTAHDNAKNITADAELKPILELQDRYINAPIEVTSWKNGKLLNASYTKYDFAVNPAGNVYPSKLQEIKLLSPSTTFTPSTTSNSTITKDSRYAEEASLVYDQGNVVKVLPKSGVAMSYVYDYNVTLPIAQITNADPADVASTSFETATGKGNFSFTGPCISATDAPTGRKVYTLSGNNITKSVDISKTYNITLWANNASVLVNNATYNRAGKTIGAYTLYNYQISGASIVTVSGSASIDELRLYPLTSQMTTYTYDPIVGMRSQCDPNNRIIYYEYDVLNRLALVRDQDKNIIKKLCYNYANQIVDCCVTTAPDWQNTATAVRCQQGPCGNTGYNEQEQKDMNSCSPSYNTIRWLAGTNQSACTAVSGMNITCQNYTSLLGYNASFTNTATGVTTTYAITTGTVNLGCLPIGAYTVTMSKRNSTIILVFGYNNNFISGTSATFNIVTGTTAATLYMDYGY